LAWLELDKEQKSLRYSSWNFSSLFLLPYAPQHPIMDPASAAVLP